jgi:hypothetical protein
VIHRTVKGNQFQLEDGEFAKIDRILDVAEAGMYSIAFKHNLREKQFQRWRWDQPELLMSWAPLRQSPGVGKNIRVLVNSETRDVFTCSFESNAWIDDRHDSEKYVRYWDHFPVGTVPKVDPQSVSSAEARTIRDYIERAYEAVSDSRDIFLSHAIRIFSSGEAETIEGSAVIGTQEVSAGDPENA